MGDWNGVPRTGVPWYPSIRVGDCASCRLCVEFCPHGVYDWDEKEEKPVVKNPFECVVGCSSCAARCPAGAIDFPPLSVLIEIKKQAKAQNG